MFCTKCKDFASFMLFSMNDLTASYGEMAESYLALFFVARIDLLLCFNFLSTVKSDMEEEVLYLCKPITPRVVHYFS